MRDASPIGERASGVLLHPTSLPGPGTGDLGEHAFRFVDWLSGARQALWQVLPLVAVNEGGSPYNALSAFAGNPLLISPAELHRHGLLPQEAASAPELPLDSIDFPAVMAWKDEVVRRAHDHFADSAGAGLERHFESYLDYNAPWIRDYALFRALRDAHGGRWWPEWPAPLRRRDPRALDDARRGLAAEVERHAYAQFL
ncbi:MAG TPA: 4-alpha-glucanotransferase, partial [Longimicrobium sp.]|nr:4-alpha-glucanotransferase [Longimicrobium sp.]